jgi:hypothetical protein
MAKKWMPAFPFISVTGPAPQCERLEDVGVAR